jgi:hypothetical protein
LESIQIPSDISYLSDGLFHSSSLSKITFQENSILESIRPTSFSKTKLTSINIPASVKDIDKNAFLNSPYLTEVIFSHNSQLEIIGDFAFAGTSLAMLDIPLSVVLIHENSFSIPKLKSIRMSISFKTREPKFGLTQEQ